MKTCNTCKETKPFTEFYKRKDAYNDPYRSDCKQCLATKAAKRYERDPLKWNIRGKAWRDANPNKERERGRKYRETHKEECMLKSKIWRKENREASREAVKRHQRKFPEKLLAQTAKRRATKKKAIPTWLSKKHLKEIQWLYKKARYLSEKSTEKYQVDHVIPLQHEFVCGLHVPWNMQLLTESENHSKNNSFDFTQNNESWKK